ncbi:hypothetical protein KKB43_03195 [Patescibacteria group bacterium]|nr:hypothetical protein [Patescibacteria group bacterium]MBU4580000.1 hypothetical protein [Patescibacteria group bacterium]
MDIILVIAIVIIILILLTIKNGIINIQNTLFTIDSNLEALKDKFAPFEVDNKNNKNNEDE